MTRLQELAITIRAWAEVEKEFLTDEAEKQSIERVLVSMKELCDLVGVRRLNDEEPERT